MTYNVFNISSVAFEWFRSYLTNRQISVYVGQSNSASATMSRDVPQCSVLDPALYTMYTALHHIIMKHNLSAHYYADDTLVYLSCEPTELKFIIERMEACVTDMLQWLLANNLSLNAFKSEVLLLGTRKQQAKMDRSAVIHIGDRAINTSDSARNFGVQLDGTLPFDEHVNSVCYNCYLHIKRLTRIRQYLIIHSAAVLLLLLANLIIATVFLAISLQLILADYSVFETV